ncbi:MAG: tyrosine-protein phosphatase [Sphingobium sp.]
MTDSFDGFGPSVLAFEGINNLRDYGRYAVEGDGRLRTGLLYRSAQHRNARIAAGAQALAKHWTTRLYAC